MVDWKYIDLQNWISNGCDKTIGEQVINLSISLNALTEIPIEIFNLTQLQWFSCCWNKIKEIPKEINCLTQLKFFDCSHNKINEIPKEISNLKQLKKFECGYNQIKEIPKEISYLIQLTTLKCSDNQIEEIPKEIKCLTQLRHFNCRYNQIKKIPKEIGYLTKLLILYCSYNQIKEIPIEIRYLTRLIEFSCNCNQIQKIPKEIRYLTQMEEFSCADNKIKEIPIEIMNCRNMRIISFNINEIDYIQPQIVRWLNNMYHEQYLYEDTQSVHNHSIQEGVSKSINYITSIKPTIQMEKLKELIINNQHLDEHVKSLLFEYMDNKEVHTILNITFEELLLSVYDFIEKNENKEELYKIMNVEISEANCMCFTGRISRLINVLNGYDENIEIHIADNEQIGNVISIIRANLGENYEESEFKRRVHEELTMRQYSEDVINEWLNNI